MSGNSKKEVGGIRASVICVFGVHGLPEMIAIGFIFLLHKWKRNTLLSIAGGTVLYMVLVQKLFH